MIHEPILAIDVGADSIKIAEFSYPSADSIVLENFAFTEYGGDYSDDQLLESLYANFRSIMEENSFSARKVHLCISGQLSFVKFVKLPPVSDASKLKSVVDFEAKQNLPFPMDEVVWDYQLLNADGAEMEAMFVVIKKDVIQRITDIIELSGRQTVLVDCSATAGYNAARLNGVGQEECCMLLNIGGRCSTLMFIDAGNYFVRTIPIAGHYITEQIMKEFNLSYDDAEDMKRRFGFVSLGGAYEEPESEVAATVSKIVRNAMTRLHGEINRSINVYRAQQNGRRPEKLYLAGGSSVMAYTSRFFEEKMRIPVEYLNPFQVISIAPKIDKTALSDVAHLFADVVGAGMRSATMCPIEINLLPDALKRAHDMRARKPFLMASAVVLMLTAGVTCMGMSIQARNIKAHPEKFKSTIEATQLIQNQINESCAALNAKNAELDVLMKYAPEQKFWVDALNDLQNIVPANAWIAQMTSPTAGETGEFNPADPSSYEQPAEGADPNAAKSKYVDLKIFIHCVGADKNGNGAFKYINDQVIKSPIFDKLADGSFRPFTPSDKDKDNIASWTGRLVFKPIATPAATEE